MVTGGLAAIIYGEPRLTNDVDIVLRLEPEGAERLIAPRRIGRRGRLEYVILRKLEYYRMASSDRHLRDIAAMRRISAAMIDRATPAAWIEPLELEPEWRKTEPGPGA